MATDKREPAGLDFEKWWMKWSTDDAGAWSGWDNLSIDEQAYLAGAFKACWLASRAAEQPADFDSAQVARAIRAHLSLGENDVALLQGYLHRAFVAGTEANRAAESAGVPQDELRGLVEKWPHDTFIDGPTFNQQEVHSSDCRRCELEAILSRLAAGRE